MQVHIFWIWRTGLNRIDDRKPNFRRLLLTEVTHIIAAVKKL